MGEALGYKKKPFALFGYGHTDTAVWYFHLGNVGNREFDRSYNLMHYGAPTLPSGNIDNDYAKIKRTNVSLFIESPVGITIYSTEKYYNSKDVHDYKWFKK